MVFLVSVNDIDRLLFLLTNYYCYLTFVLCTLFS
uniref:Uncharacterized protein n=1 Tax=Anguilla anguilla TaxID=7936 RepID=A0A0E9PWE3_ANGAN